MDMHGASLDYAQHLRLTFLSPLSSNEIDVAISGRDEVTIYLHSNPFSSNHSMMAALAAANKAAHSFISLIMAVMRHGWR